MSQQSAAHYLRHGQTPFFRLPTVDLSLPASDGYQGAHAVLIGAPYDGGTTYQPGARLAPYHVRRVSALVQTYHPVHRVDVFDKVRVVDGGNVSFPPFDPAAVRARIEDEVSKILAAGAAPFLVGGDHTVTLPALRAMALKHGPVAVVHIDSHSDTSGPSQWGDPWHHGSPFRHALEENLIAPNQLHQIGLRGPWGTSEDGMFALAHGAQFYTAEEVAERGVMDVMAEVMRSIGELPVYLSFDIGAVDPAFAPGTGLPVPGGLTSREALQLVRELQGVKLCGMDLVEVAPPLDTADVTSHLAAHLLYEGIALLALR